MTVASTQNRKTFAGDDATTSFATTPVKFFDTSDLLVYVTNDTTGAAWMIDTTNLPAGKSIYLKVIAWLA